MIRSMGSLAALLLFCGIFLAALPDFLFTAAGRWFAALWISVGLAAIWAHGIRLSQVQRHQKKLLLRQRIALGEKQQKGASLRRQRSMV